MSCTTVSSSGLSQMVRKCWPFTFTRCGYDLRISSLAYQSLRRATIASLTLFCLAPTASRHLKPGASPQEFELPCKQALKARFNRRVNQTHAGDESRLQRCRVTPYKPLGVPQGLRLNTAPLALNTNSRSAKLHSAVYGRPGAGWPNSATRIFCSEKLSSVSIHWLPARG